MTSNRFERQILFFGKNGQESIKKAEVAVVGVGGLGSHVVQQLAHLGVGSLTLIDPDYVELSNLNRLVGATHLDLIAGLKKVEIAERVVKSVDSSIAVSAILEDLRSLEAIQGVKKSTHVFGCLDNDGSRLVLNELCLAYEIPYIDLASDIIEDNGLYYGGRVMTCFDDGGCIYCFQEVQPLLASQDLASASIKKDMKDIYGVAQKDLDCTGPSVISINGVVSSLGVTEFIVLVTGLRRPERLLTYRGEKGIVAKSVDSPMPDCYYCKYIRGRGEKANLERYLKDS